MKRLLLKFVVASLTLLFAIDAPAQIKRKLPPRSIQVYIEDSPAARELIDHAHRLAQQQRLADAINTYQKVIEQYPRKLVLIAASEDEQKVYQDAAD